MRTRAAYIARIDPLCRRAKTDPEETAVVDAINKVLGESLGAEQAAAKLAPLWAKEAASQRNYNALIAAVPKPSADGGSLAKIAAARESVAALDERIAELLRTHPEIPAYQALVKARHEENDRLGPLDRGYGFKVCGAP